MNPLLGSVVERERLTVSSTFETDSESHAVGAVLFLLLLAVENQKRPLGQTWIGDDAKTHPRSPARECDMSDRGYTTYFGRYSFCRLRIHFTVYSLRVRIWLRFTIHHSIHSGSWRFRCSYGHVSRSTLTIDSAGIRAVYAGTGYVCV